MLRVSTTEPTCFKLNNRTGICTVTTSNDPSLAVLVETAERLLNPSALSV